MSQNRSSEAAATTQGKESGERSRELVELKMLCCTAAAAGGATSATTARAAGRHSIEPTQPTGAQLSSVD